MNYVVFFLALIFFASQAHAGDEYCPEDSIRQELNSRSWPDSTSRRISEILLRATRCESSTWYKIDPLYAAVDSIPMDSIRAYFQHPPSRLPLIRLISHYKMSNMINFLHALLAEDPDIYVRSQSAAALSVFGPKAAIAIPALIEALRDKSKSGLCANAIQALGQMGEKGAPGVPFLTAMLKDERWYIRWRAARSLGELGRLSYPALPVLQKLLEDDHKQVRQFAAEAIALIELSMNDL